MKELQLLIALGEIDDAYIVEAAPAQQNKRRWIRWAALAACFALIVTGGIAVLLHSGALDPQISPIILSERSSGVKVEYTLNPRDTTSEACLVWLELEEIFSPQTTIFRGRVSRIDNIELDFNGRKSYRAIVSICVDEVLQGDVKAGEIVRVLAPCPINNGEVTQSATDVIAQLCEGMEGIFMPKAYNEDSFWEENGATLYLCDVAPYGFWDGMRWAFLDTDAGLVFEKNVYKEIASAGTLDQVEAYIRDQLG